MVNLFCSIIIGIIIRFVEYLGSELCVVSSGSRVYIYISSSEGVRRYVTIKN